MIGECDCCRTVQDVHPLGELGWWCDTCACETGGCLHAAMDEAIAVEAIRQAGRYNGAVTWAHSDEMHKQLGSTVRNHDKAWTYKPKAETNPPNPQPTGMVAGWWAALVGNVNYNPEVAA